MSSYVNRFVFPNLKILNCRQQFFHFIVNTSAWKLENVLAYILKDSQIFFKNWASFFFKLNFYTEFKSLGFSLYIDMGYLLRLLPGIDFLLMSPKNAGCGHLAL